ncbi:MAG: hypothetical protein DME26_03550, partial [Verrucomicrobia bacterium]
MGRPSSAESNTAIRQIPNLRYSAARQSRNQIVIVLLLVLALDSPISDDKNEDDDEDESVARPATIWTDTDRVQLRAASDFVEMPLSATNTATGTPTKRHKGQNAAGERARWL